MALTAEFPLGEESNAYALFPDRLEVECKNGKATRKWSVEFKDCDDRPGRGTTIITTLPNGFWLLFLTILVSTGSSVLLAILADRFVFPENKPGWIILIVGIYGGGSFMLLALHRRYRKRHLCRLAAFRYIRGPNLYFTMGISDKEPTDSVDLILAYRRFHRWKAKGPLEMTDEFERFVFAVSAAISEFHLGQSDALALARMADDGCPHHPRLPFARNE